MGLRVCFWGLLVGAVLSASASPQDPASIRFATSVFFKVLKQCPERIWPGVDWAGQRFIFTAPSAGRAWILDESASNKMTSLSIGTLPRELLTDSFSITKSAVSVNLDEFSEDPTEPMRVAVHELFHKLGQGDWKLRANPRSPIFPFDPRPRIARAQLLAALKEHAVGKTDLGAAAFWFRSWQRRYPEENAASTDQNEGTARYTERRLLALNQLGCGATTQQLWNYDLEWINRSYLNSDRGLTIEGYVLGAVAGLILDSRGEPWKPRMAEGRSPLDVLLGSHSETAVKGDPNIDGMVTRAIKNINSLVSSSLAPGMKKLESTKIFRVAIPDQWDEQTEIREGDFSSTEDRSMLYSIFPPQNFSGPSGRLRITKSVVAYSLVGKSGPCLNALYYFPVEGSLVRERSGRMDIRTPYLSATFRGQRIVRDGFTYLCPATE